MHWPAIVTDVLRLGLWLGLIVALFVPLERLCAARRQKILRAGFGQDVAYYFLTNMLPKLALVAPLSLLAWAAHRALPGGFYWEMSRLPFALRLAAALFVGETGYYWAHRLSHEVPLLWRFHAIHHSAEAMDFLVNTRAHPVDIVWGRLWSLAPVYLLGLAQPLAGRLDAVPLIVAFAGGLWGFFVHANLAWRFGPLEHVLATPAFHHWHHTNDGPEVIDRNYSSMLPLLDHVFGTFFLPARRPARFGITGTMAADLAGQLVQPFAPHRDAMQAGTASGRD